MTRSNLESDDHRSGTRTQTIRALALRMADPVLRQLLEQVANGDLPVQDAVEHALNHVDRRLQSDETLGLVSRALSLADAALGAEGLQVSEIAVRRLGERVARGQMTGDEASAFINALLPSGVIGPAAQSQASTLDERAGPFFDAASLIGLLRVDEDTLTALVDHGNILAVITADGFLLYPEFQFDKTGRPLPRLPEVLTQLDPALSDPWGDAVWLNAPSDDLGGLSPAAALRHGRAEDVIRLASVAGSFYRG